MSVPAPPQADLGGAIAMLPKAAARVFLRVRDRQAFVRRASAAFMAACRRLGLGPHAPVRARAAREGWFRELADGREVGLAGDDEAQPLIDAWVGMLDPSPTHAS
jgi:hypothetical protein